MRLWIWFVFPTLSAFTYGQTCPTPSALQAALNGATQASVVGLAGVNPLNCPEIAMTETWSGGVLIFSDSPESPSMPGILYQDGTLSATPKGISNRIFLYHVNGNASGRMKFAVLITNTGTDAGELAVTRRGTAGPTTAYSYAGKVAFERWLNSAAGAPATVGPGETVELDSGFDATTAAPGNLMHGIWDYSFAQPHRVTVCALNEGDDPSTVCPNLPVASRDQHQRGSFPYADKVYDSADRIDTAAGIQQFPLAGNTPNDANAQGIDQTDGSCVILSGNYGVLYRIHVSTQASDGGNFGMLINPRGGAWAGAVQALRGILSGGVFLLPAGTGSVSDNTQGAVDGEYRPGAGLTVWLRWMATGGTSLPVRFVAVPF